MSAQLPNTSGTAVQLTSARGTPQSMRVEMIGRKLQAASAQTSAKIEFLVPGTPALEIYHPLPNRIVISEGLVNRCQTDDQLAALLALELAKLTTEQQTRVDSQEWAVDRDPPPEVLIGPEANLRGYADQYRKAELVKLGLDRRRPAQAKEQRQSDPILVARQYLTAAGYQAAELESAPLLLQSATKVSPLR
jgi:hypothetical protein